MKKIVLFGGYLPDIVEKAMGEKKLDRFSPELVEMVENARVITAQEEGDIKVIDELKRTGELVRYRDNYFARGYNAEHDRFCTVCVCTYDETHRHFIGEYNGNEVLFDLERLQPAPGTPADYNLWSCTNCTML